MEPIRVEAGSWLGAGVLVLPGVTIGHGSVIAAGAVVTKSTCADGLYAGVPARRVRDLPAGTIRSSDSTAQTNRYTSHVNVAESTRQSTRLRSPSLAGFLLARMSRLA